VETARVRTAFVLTLALFVLACGLPRNLRRTAEAVPSRLAATAAAIGDKEREYRAFAASPEYADYRMYAEREAWARQFEAAREQVGAARASFDRDIVPLLERNRAADDVRLEAQLVAIDRLVAEATRLAAVPMRRRGYIDDVRVHYRERFQAASDSVARMKLLMAELAGRARKAEGEFPLRRADIDKRTSEVAGLQATAEAAFAKVAGEAARANAAQVADLVALDDNTRVVSENTGKLMEEAKDLTTQLSSLSTSYSKALADMRAAYLMTVERWSWNEDVDEPSVHHYTYPAREISGDVFDYFNGLPESLPYVARYTSGLFGRMAVAGGIDPAQWSALGIAPTADWPSRSDDTAEFGFRLSADYFHKYLVTEDGKVTETDWQPVDETTFERHVGDLGMDLVSKPYGAFEDEKIVNPTPAGLAFVGNPQYGQWRVDDRGMSFWAWYGAYRLFSDLLGARGLPYNYRRDEWTTWSTRHRGEPYYGEDKDKRERYGTGGYVTGSSSRYENRIPEMRRTTVRHGASGPVGRGTVASSGK
jgi:hypothetical protein